VVFGHRPWFSSDVVWPRFASHPGPPSRSGGIGSRPARRACVPSNPADIRGRRPPWTCPGPADVRVPLVPRGPISTRRTFHAWLRATAVLSSLLCTACSGHGPAEGDQWDSLGLTGHRITALRDTDWGLFAGTPTGLFRLEPGSGGWEAAGLDNRAVSEIVVLPGTSPRLLVAVGPGVPDTSRAGIFASEDAGRTWAAVNQQYWPWSLALDPGKNGRLFMGGSYSVLRSEDYGATWEFVFGSADSRGGGIGSITVSAAGAGRVWAGGQTAFEAGVVLLSENGGSAWDVVLARGPVNVVLSDPVSGSRVWAGIGGGGVDRSDDAGRTWRNSLAAKVWVHELVFLDDLLYAVGRETSFVEGQGFREPLRLFRLDSPDGGWQEVATPELPAGLSATVDQNGYLVIGTNGGGVWRFVP